MWACKNEGEDARLYAAVESCSNFAIELGINIPTGKTLHETEIPE
jgi:phosphoribosylformylglycinamidine synthase